MAFNPADHSAEETIEKYAMAKLAESEVAPFEEHLLMCDGCQERLQQMDTFVHATKAALAKLRPEPSFPERLSALSAIPPRWASVAGLGAAILALIILRSRPSVPTVGG
jgi:anti-sigma factor RsiW